MVISGRFRLLLRLWCCFLLFAYLPLEMVVRLDSFLLSMSGADLAVNVSGMILILVVIAAATAVLATPLSLLRSRLWRGLNKRHEEPTPGAVITPYLLLVVTSLLFAYCFKVWLFKIGHSVPIRSLHIGLLLAATVCWHNGTNFHQRLNSLCSKAGSVISVLTVVALMVVCLRIATRGHAVGSAGASPSVTATSALPEGRNVILITFDALSAEDIALYGYPRQTMPNLAAFAEECSIFDNAIAAANCTRPSIASLLTGKYPSSHRLINLNSYCNSVAAAHQSLPALLKASGYRLSTLNANWGNAHPHANGTAPFFDYQPFTGIDFKNLRWHNRLVYRMQQMFYPLESRYSFGFLVWLANIWYEWGGMVDHHLSVSEPAFPPEMIFASAKKTVSQQSDRPQLLWLHLWPPHSDYLTPKGITGRFLPGTALTDNISQGALKGFYPLSAQPSVDLLRLRYDENILYADRALGQFLRFLKERGQMEKSIIIISADHGESFDHGFCGHAGPQLYQPLVHIPLLVRVPGGHSKKRITTPVSQTDIAPTIADLLGCGVPSWMDGRSLKGEMTGTGTPVPVYTMDLEGNPIRGVPQKGSVAVISDGFKYIHNIATGAGELYDFGKDKSEKRNLAQSDPKRVELMRKMALDRIRAAKTEGMAPAVRGKE